MAESVDVLFIHPGNRSEIYQNLSNEYAAVEPPAFAALFAQYLRNKGASVDIVDGYALNLNSEDLARKSLEYFSPKLVVIAVYGHQPSASTQNMTAAGEVARYIKEDNPNVPILMTGTHPAALPLRTMQEESIDFLCDLEGPVTVYKLLQAINAKVSNFENIPSLWWREEEIIRRPLLSEPLIKDLDAELNGMAWDLLPMDRYKAHNWHCFSHIDNRSPYVSIHTSLGCPYSCNFCCINAPFGKSSYRMWSPQFVVDEIELLVNKYGVYNIKIIDEMFVLNQNHVIGICNEIIRRKLEVNIWAYARVDTVKEEFLPLLKAAGINWLCLGIESASEYVRDGADKRYGSQDILNIIRKIQGAGINILGNYIFGLPDDTHERMKDTLDLAVELNCEFANFYSAMAYPGSQLYNTAIANKWELPSRWHDYSQHGYDSKPLANENLSTAEILAFRDQAFNTYFTNESYLSMVKNKFGDKVEDHIVGMVGTKLPRRVLEVEEVA